LLLFNFQTIISYFYIPKKTVFYVLFPTVPVITPI